MMYRFNVYYGKYPFTKQLGSITMPTSEENAALAAALAQYKSQLPEGEQPDPDFKYQDHPVIGPAIALQ